ncbi:periplasmic nitrate reductase, NapE protein [Aliikangiella coralliicola]|uniref:Periplasmic nitrate reductase, NapE protein n=1 Tax=Aliikangiella coralliicola TaxID=2592383 RepID=A0A545U906_9GAMM|nr:periplasmic nitrate reductase, NapE protein [Aliikangiella coralliicola]TQV85952.1 periplasmic nitrate reductase, NapE protein [Aliikangiella coralliicola]
MEDSDNAQHDSAETRRTELNTFLFLTIFVAPILSVMIVGGYGFIVWISQMYFGPPTGG